MKLAPLICDYFKLGIGIFIQHDFDEPDRRFGDVVTTEDHRGTPVDAQLRESHFYQLLRLQFSHHGNARNNRNANVVAHELLDVLETPKLRNHITVDPMTSEDA